jgi:hypothetical protein
VFRIKKKGHIGLSVLTETRGYRKGDKEVQPFAAASRTAPVWRPQSSYASINWVRFKGSLNRAVALSASQSLWRDSPDILSFIQAASRRQGEPFKALFRRLNLALQKTTVYGFSTLLNNNLEAVLNAVFWLIGV